MNSDVKKEEIARKNDVLRRTFAGGQVVITSGLKDDPNLDKIIKAVQTFDDFSDDNDPYLERDFGKVTIDGEGYLWKIDYYDADHKYFQKDGHRVLTILRSDEN